jgi:molybdate transport system ATP-binding protein
MRLNISIPGDGSRLDLEGLELLTDSTTVVFGPNGAGKSTLLRYLAGFFEGPGLGSVAYLQQRPYLFRGTAGFNLGLGLGAESAARGRQIAERLGLGGLLSREAPSLSGGQRQRLVLARALATPADWVLLDEPLAPVDLADREELLQVLAGELHGRSVVLVTHDIAVVASLARSLAILDHGRLVEQGPVSEVIGSPSGVRSAEILGKANLIDGTARLEGELCVLAAGPVEIAGVGLAEGPARALFGAEAITLRPAGTGGTSSARNVWKGTIGTILHRGQLVEVAVDIGERLVAVITPGGLADLALEPGGEVEVAVKASAVRIVTT